MTTDKEHIPENNTTNIPRRRGRPPKNWAARSMLVMPLPLAFMQNSINRSQRDLDVIGRWLGVNGRREPMKEIAERHNISGERCRQIVKRFGFDVLGADEGMEVFLSACADATAAGPISLFQLGTRKPFEGIYLMPMILVHVLDIIRMIDSDRTLPEVSGDQSGMALLPIDKASWERAGTIAKRIVRLADPEAVYRRLSERLPNLSPGQLKHLIEAAKAAGSLSTLELGDIREAVKILLEDSPDPVPVSEISRRMEQLTGKRPKENYVRNTASAVGVRIGRGLYTSEQKLGLSREDIDAIIEIICKVVRQDEPDRQWRPSEFIDDIARVRPDLAQIKTETVSCILSGYDQFQSTGRMVFRVKVNKPKHRQ